MRQHAAMMATILGSLLTAGSGRAAVADVVIDLPPPPPSAKEAAKPAAPSSDTIAPSGAPDEAAAPVSAGTIALERYGGRRAAPRGTDNSYAGYGPYYGYGSRGTYGYGYGYGPYAYYGYYPFLGHHHFGLRVHLNHGRARFIGRGFW